MTAPDDVIAFWFGHDLVPSQAIVRRWFTRDAAFDTEVRRKFGYLLDDVDELAVTWRGTPHAELALIVVVDQFARNVHRDDARAYLHDPLALEVARELLLTDRARQLGFHQRMVALLPLEHAEDRDAQVECVYAFTQLVEEARSKGAQGLELLERGFEFAKQHAATIERFGRFPHRNKLLGRASTPEELAFVGGR
ncbi:MAG: DUF924 family protein [Kofleriaceae bacterium]